MKVWYNAVRQRPSVCATLADKKELILNYADYADGTATSDVAHRFGNVSAGAAEAVVSNTSHEDLVVMNEQDYNGGYDYGNYYLLLIYKRLLHLHQYLFLEINSLYW